MRRTLRRAAMAAGALALAGSFMSVATLPAYAASENEAYIFAASGLVTVHNLDEADYPPDVYPSSDNGVTLTAAVTGGLISATSGIVDDDATATSASSTVASLTLGVATLGLSITTLQASCVFNSNTGTVSGTTTIAGGDISGLGIVTVPFVPTLTNDPTTLLSLAGVTITEDAQSTNGSGTLTVTALQIVTAVQTIDIGNAVCNSANVAPVPMLPSAAAQAGASGLAAMAILGGGYSILRRRRAATLA
jgi:hypothetical protein